MVERLCQEVAQFLAEHDDRADNQAAGLVRARVAISLAEALAGETSGCGDQAAGADDPERLAAFLDHGLSEPERNALVTALAGDVIRRTEANAAAAFLDGIDGDVCPPLPAALLARAVETFGHRAAPERGQPVGPRPLSSSLRPPGALRPVFAALVVAAVMTPVVLSFVWDRRDVSVGNTRDGPTTRSLTPSPGTGKKTPERSTDEPVAHSCAPAGKAAQGDQPAGLAHDSEVNPAEPADGGMKKPEDGGVTRSPGPLARDPCDLERSVGDGHALGRPTTGARN